MAAGWQEHGTRTVLEEVGCPKNKKQQQRHPFTSCQLCLAQVWLIPSVASTRQLASGHSELVQAQRDSMEGPVPEVDFSAFGTVELPLPGESLELTERQRQVGKQLYDILTTHGGLGRPVTSGVHDVTP